MLVPAPGAHNSSLAPAQGAAAHTPAAPRDDLAARVDARGVGQHRYDLDHAGTPGARDAWQGGGLAGALLKEQAGAAPMGEWGGEGLNGEGGGEAPRVVPGAPVASGWPPKEAGIEEVGAESNPGGRPCGQEEVVHGKECVREEEPEQEAVRELGFETPTLAQLYEQDSIEERLPDHTLGRQVRS